MQEIGILMTVDEFVHVWYYDRTGAVQSTGLSIIAHFPHFLVLLLALQRFKRTDWGSIPELTPTPNDPDLIALRIKWKESTNAETEAIAKIDLKNPIRNDWGLVRRSTAVYPCSIVDMNGGVLEQDAVVKWSWPEISRTPEFETVKRLAILDDPDVKGHVPFLLAGFNIEDSETYQIRKDLDSEPHHKNGRSRNARQLVITVWKRLYPVWTLSAAEWVTVFVDCFLCMFVD
jgi:hypothetical protein